MSISLSKLLVLLLLTAFTLAASACSDCRRCGYHPDSSVIIQYQGGTQRLVVTDASGCVYPNPGSGESCDSVTITQVQ